MSEHPARDSGADAPEGRPTYRGPSDDEELIMFLEHDQLTAGRRVILQRARLSRSTQVALWALRIFALVVSALVIYTFIAQLG